MNIGSSKYRRVPNKDIQNSAQNYLIASIPAVSKRDRCLMACNLANDCVLIVFTKDANVNCKLYNETSLLQNASFYRNDSDIYLKQM